MKLLKFCLLLICFIITGQFGFSQAKHIRGIEMGGLSIGYTDKVIELSGSYERFLNYKYYLKGNITYQQINFGLSKYKAGKINPEFIYNILNNKFIYLNGKVGLFTGMEFHESEIFNKKYNQIYFGEGIGPNIELYIIHSIKIEIDLTQEFYQRSKVINNLLIIKVGLFVSI